MAMTHSENAQSAYVVHGHAAAAQIRRDSLIQNGIVQTAAQLTSDNRFQRADSEQLLAGQDASALPGLLADSIDMTISAGMISHAVALCCLFTLHICMHMSICACIGAWTQ